MSFFALATLLTVTSLENAVINQTNALDDWRSGLGFLSAQSESEAATATSAGVDEFVLTAVNAQALDELDEEYQLDRITEVDAIITNPDLFRDDDDRIADITPDVTATFSSLSPSEASATVSPALETPNEADTPSATAKEADPKADTSVYSPGDPLREQQWALDQIGVTDATPRGSGKQKIAVIDSGVWDQHPDLAGRVTAQYHVVDGKVENGPVKVNRCRRGHGTLVAGITSATGFNGIGGRGIAPNAELISIDATTQTNCEVGPTLSGTIAAIDLAINLKADTIITSYGFRLNYCPLGLQQAIDRARAAGIVFVAAAGNQAERPSRHVPETPASCDGVISVGATQRGGKIAAYSTRNDWVDIAAPGGSLAGGSSFGPYGTHVLTTNWPESPGYPKVPYTGASGTSFATPHVAGLVALIRQIRPTATPDEVEAIIEHTATRTTDKASTTLGWGEVNVPRALELAASTGPLPAAAFNLPYPVGPQSVRPGTGRVQTISRFGQAQDPITRAVEISQYTFIDQGGDPHKERRGQAQWGVLARADVHADALAGASLTLGVGPLLYTTNTLHDATATELTRTLTPGSTVYLLGGPQALPPSMDAAIARLGFKPVRLAGATRIETSASIANEVRRLVKEEANIDVVPASLVTAEDAWSDSVGAGHLGATAGLPVLLNPKEELHPLVQTATSRDELIYVVGGAGRVSDHVVWTLENKRKRGDVVRLAGSDRVRTMIKTAAQLERVRGASMKAVDVINFTNESAWATALAAAVPGAAFAHLPVAVDINRVDEDVLRYVNGYAVPVQVWGPTTVVSDDVANAVRGAVSAKSGS